MGLIIGIFRNFRDCFWIVRAKFWDSFWTVRAEFSELFSNSPNRIFGTIFAQSWTVLRFGFDLGTDIFVFCGVFWYFNNLMTNREGTKRCLVVYGSKIWVILYVIVEKLNIMLLYVKFMLICACGMY